MGLERELQTCNSLSLHKKRKPRRRFPFFVVTYCLNDLIFLKLFRLSFRTSFHITHIEGSNNDMLRFEEVLMYINEHLDSRITTKKLASIANLSEVYFSNLFTKTFGISPIKYINHKKMNVAATMLAENIMSAKEIAFSLGFNNTMYFFRLFKKTFGLTPGQYKAKCNSVLTSSKNE